MSTQYAKCWAVSPSPVKSPVGYVIRPTCNIIIWPRIWSFTPVCWNTCWCTGAIYVSPLIFIQLIQPYLRVECHNWLRYDLWAPKLSEFLTWSDLLQKPTVRSAIQNCHCSCWWYLLFNSEILLHPEGKRRGKARFQSVNRGTAPWNLPWTTTWIIRPPHLASTFNLLPRQKALQIQHAAQQKWHFER